MPGGNVTRQEAVRVAYRQLVEQRRDGGPHQSNSLHPDRVTAVSFGGTAVREPSAAGMPVSLAATAAVAVSTLGGTNYKAGLEAAAAAMTEVQGQPGATTQPFLIFLSDGEPTDSEEGRHAELEGMVKLHRVQGLRMLFILCGADDDEDDETELLKLARKGAAKLGCCAEVGSSFDGPFVCPGGCGAQPSAAGGAQPSPAPPLYHATSAQHKAHMAAAHGGAQHECSTACLAVFPAPTSVRLPLQCTAAGCGFVAADAPALAAHELLHTRVAYIQARNVNDLNTSFKAAKATETKAGSGIIRDIADALSKEVLKATQSVIMDNY